jgi:hypothetical protein
VAGFGTRGHQVQAGVGVPGGRGGSRGFLDEVKAVLVVNQ